MRVTVVRTGGFAGIELRGAADTDSDPVLRRLIDRVDFGAVPSPGRVPDQFIYEIAIDGHVLTVGESRLTTALRELVHHVLQH